MCGQWAPRRTASYSVRGWTTCWWLVACPRPREAPTSGQLLEVRPMVRASLTQAGVGAASAARLRCFVPHKHGTTQQGEQCISTLSGRPARIGSYQHARSRHRFAHRFAAAETTSDLAQRSSRSTPSPLQTATKTLRLGCAHAHLEREQSAPDRDLLRHHPGLARLRRGRPAQAKGRAA